MLPNGDTKEVVCDTCSEQEGREESSEGPAGQRTNRRQCIRRDAFKPPNRGVVEEVENATESSEASLQVGLHSSKGNVDCVRELGLVRARRWITQVEHVVELSESVEGHGNVRAFHVVAVLGAFSAFCQAAMSYSPRGTSRRQSTRSPAHTTVHISLSLSPLVRHSCRALESRAAGRSAEGQRNTLWRVAEEKRQQGADHGSASCLGSRSYHMSGTQGQSCTRSAPSTRTRQCATESWVMRRSRSRSTYMKEAGASHLAIERVIPMLPNGAVG